MRMVDVDDVVPLYRYSSLLQVWQQQISPVVLADSGSIFPGCEDQQQPTYKKGDTAQGGDNPQGPDP
jgi:hypothetical protein